MDYVKAEDCAAGAALSGGRKAGKAGKQLQSQLRSTANIFHLRSQGDKSRSRSFANCETQCLQLRFEVRTSKACLLAFFFFFLFAASPCLVADASRTSGLPILISSSSSLASSSPSSFFLHLVCAISSPSSRAHFLLLIDCQFAH